MKNDEALQTAERVRAYETEWSKRGYFDGIPDEAPEVLERLGLVPSYRTIAFALLKNDMNLVSVGFSTKKSDWYSAIKRVEIDARPGSRVRQRMFDFMGFHLGK
jgi:predicted phosphoadenosine phosphosulfate sulfurtransferase